MPEQICNKCIDDLEVAYKFRTNCESSEAILRSYGIETNEADVDEEEEEEEASIVNDSEVESKKSFGEVYKFNPPYGLDVRLVRQPIKIEPTGYEEDNTVDVEDNVPINEELTTDNLEPGELDEPNDESDYLDDSMIDRVERIDASEQPEEITASSETHPTPVLLTSVYWEAVMPDKSEKEAEETEEIENSEEKAEILHIKPVRTNKARQTQPPPPIPGILQQTFIKCEDGTKLIRLKRVFDPKPMKVCEICGNQYKYQHALDSHMRRHRNEKPFECE